MKFEPCIPKDWKEYLIRYKWGKSIYNIKIKNPNQKNTGVEKVFLNGRLSSKGIRLDGNNGIYNVEVIM